MTRNGRRTVEDLREDADDDAYLMSSVGGAMAQWPRRTLNWLCRDMRINSLDPYVAKRLVDREISDLQALVHLASEVDINAKELQRKKLALEHNSINDVIGIIDMEYENEYEPNGDDWTSDKCPYEENGMDMDCQRCPVAGNVLDELSELYEQSDTDRELEV